MRSKEKHIQPRTAGALLLRAFSMQKLADSENATVITPPQYNHIVFPRAAAHSAHKNHPKTAVIFGTVACATCSMTVMQLSACTTVKAVFEPVENTVDGLPALKSQGFALRHKYSKTAVDALLALDKYLETTVDALPVLNKQLETAVDGFSALDKYAKTVVDGLPALKKCQKTAVDSLPAFNKHLKTAVDTLPAFNKYLETAVDDLPALNKCLETAVDTLPALKECQKTAVDALSSLKERTKTAIDGILSPGGHIRHGCLRNLLNDRAVFERVENTAKYIITQKIKRRISV